MTDKQQLFVTEYLKDFNATRAALEAGYSEDTAYSIGWENLRKPEIKEALEKAKEEILGDATRDIIENVKFWRDMRDSDESNEAARLKASEMLGKYRAMFTEKVEQTNKSKIIIEVVDPENQ